MKSINDWYAQRERGTAVGIFNSSTVLGQAIAPPALVIMQLAWGWRTMFVVIGLAGILVGLCWYVGYRNRRNSLSRKRSNAIWPARRRPGRR